MPNAKPSKSTPNFAVLAKRISAWTTRGLLSALVLAAGLGLGRQIMQWWAAPTAAALPSAQPADPEADCMISFGQSPWAMSRRTITGGKQQAVEALRAFCREMLVKYEGTLTSDIRDEQPLLKILSETKPVDWQPGRWRLYEMSEVLPMAVGLARENKQNPSKIDETARMDLAQDGYRVVIWAFAAPSAEGQWTLMVFQPDAEHRGETSEASALPPGCRRTMAVRTADGWEIVGFRGSADAEEEIKSFFDRQASNQGAKPSVGWQTRGNAWHAKYIGPDNRAVEVRFGPEVHGELGGIMMIYPTSNSPNPQIPKSPNPQ